MAKLHLVQILEVQDTFSEEHDENQLESKKISPQSSESGRCSENASHRWGCLEA